MKKKLEFYTQEDVKEMENALKSSTLPIKALSFEFAKKPSFSKHSRRSVEQKLQRINKRLSIPHRKNTKKKVESFSFYSQDELNEMTHAISTTSTPISALAREFAAKYNRGVAGVTCKLHTMSNHIVRPAKDKKSYYIREGITTKPAKIKVEKINVAVPQTIGIDVPEGTSFDIQNVKRVVLQKDCFTIYF